MNKLNFKNALLITFFIILNFFNSKNKTEEKSANLTEDNNLVYTNPILGGDYTDPTILRVGSDYYMTHSSFIYYPGLFAFGQGKVAFANFIYKVLD